MEEQKCEYCGGTESVDLVENPFQSEINDNHDLHWMCYQCYMDSLGDI